MLNTQKRWGRRCKIADRLPLSSGPAAQHDAQRAVHQSLRYAETTSLRYPTLREIEKPKIPSATSTADCLAPTEVFNIMFSGRLSEKLQRLE